MKFLRPRFEWYDFWVGASEVEGIELMGMDKLRGFDLGNGLLLAPHYGTDENEAIHYEPVTPENVHLKLRAIREFCLRLEEDGGKRFVNGMWVSGHIMCILKYGDGFQQEQLPHLRSELSGSPKRPWWKFW